MIKVDITPELLVKIKSAYEVANLHLRTGLKITKLERLLKDSLLNYTDETVGVEKRIYRLMRLEGAIVVLTEGETTRYLSTTTDNVCACLFALQGDSDALTRLGFMLSSFPPVNATRAEGKGESLIYLLVGMALAFCNIYTNMHTRLSIQPLAHLLHSAISMPSELIC